MQDLGREEVVSLLLTNSTTVAKASEMSGVIAISQCSDVNTSATNFTGAKLPCTALLRKEEANSRRMQLLGGIMRKARPVPRGAYWGLRVTPL